MSVIDDVFEKLRVAGRKAFIAFVPAGDPDLKFTEELLQGLSAVGVTLCELGLPYSDPIADGPVIQAAYTRTLARGVRVHEIFELLQRVTPRLACPVVLMTSYAIVFRRGLEMFVQECARKGVAGLVVPDLPVEESRPLADVCGQFDLSLIQLVTPTTPPDRALRIAAESSGFLYYVSVTGITGERDQLPPELAEKVAWLRKHTDLPICVGFGISRPEQVAALAGVADGVIVGSALVRRIAQAESLGPQSALEDTLQFVRSLLAALPHQPVARRI